MRSSAVVKCARLWPHSSTRLWQYRRTHRRRRIPEVPDIVRLQTSSDFFRLPLASTQIHMNYSFLGLSESSWSWNCNFSEFSQSPKTTVTGSLKFANKLVVSWLWQCHAGWLRRWSPGERRESSSLSEHVADCSLTRSGSNQRWVIARLLIHHGRARPLR